MFSLGLLNLLAWSEFAVSAPVSVSENDKGETTSWRSEPSTRGTFRLIFSCLTTLTICVYTAVHLNVPKKGTTRLARYREKAGWVLLGVVAPELVVYTAWAQWYSAKSLLAGINISIQNKNETAGAEGALKLEPWTLTQAFYAGMGGFVIDTKAAGEKKEHIAGSPRLTVTSRGVEFLIHLSIHEIVPAISNNFISDKSKANGFAKLLACLQGSWIIIQCIVRLRCHLPITLLEINTVGHVLCALGIFGFWFSKPLDIEEPTVLDGKNIRFLSALMWVNSLISKDKIRRYPCALTTCTELDSLLFTAHEDTNLTESKLEPDCQDNERDSRPVDPITPVVVYPSEHGIMTSLRPNHVLAGTCFTLNPESSRFAWSDLKRKERKKNHQRPRRRAL